jgi:hypothetical protein
VKSALVTVLAIVLARSFDLAPGVLKGKEPERAAVSHLLPIARRDSFTGADAATASFKRPLPPELEFPPSHQPPTTLMSGLPPIAAIGWSPFISTRPSTHVRRFWHMCRFCRHLSDGRFDEPQIFSIVASAPSVKFRNSHPVSAFSPAAPSAHTVLTSIVEKCSAF